MEKQIRLKNNATKVLRETKKIEESLEEINQTFLDWRLRHKSE